MESLIFNCHFDDEGGEICYLKYFNFMHEVKDATDFSLVPRCQ